MTMPWFKLFHEARTDPKLRALSRDQHYVWFNLLCYANEQPERGVIKIDDDEVLACAVADGDVGLLRSSLERLVKLQLIDRTESGITPHGWSERQGRVDTTSAERSRRYRERHKAPKAPRKTPSRVTERDATRDERVTSRPVTAPSRETSRYRDRDKEEENKDKTTQESVDVLKFDSLKEEPCPAYPEGDGGMWDIFPGQHPMSEGQARQLFKAIWDCWGNQKLCFEFYQRQSRYTYEVWRAAFAKTKAQGTAVHSLAYIERIAADYQANGIPKDKPAPVAARRSASPGKPDPAWRPLNPPGTVIPEKYRNPPQRIGSA